MLRQATTPLDAVCAASLMAALCALFAARIWYKGWLRNHAQVAKNVTLAGVGSVTLMDDTPCSDAARANFLIPADAEAAQRCTRPCGQPRTC